MMLMLLVIISCKWKSFKKSENYFNGHEIKQVIVMEWNFNLKAKKNRAWAWVLKVKNFSTKLSEGEGEKFSLSFSTFNIKLTKLKRVHHPKVRAWSLSCYLLHVHVSSFQTFSPLKTTTTLTLLHPFSPY